jgi:hypothetical protein
LDDGLFYSWSFDSVRGRCIRNYRLESTEFATHKAEQSETKDKNNKKKKGKPVNPKKKIQKPKPKKKVVPTAPPIKIKEKP